MVLRRLANDGAIYGGSDLLTKILSLLAFPMIAAALSPEAYGALELISTLTLLLGSTMNCGLNNALQRFYWDIDTTPVMRPAFVSSGFIAQVGFGIITIMIGLVSIPFVMPVMRAAEWPLTWISLLAALLVMVISQWSQYVLDVIRLHFAPWRFFTLAFTSRVLTIAFGLIAVVSLRLGVDGLLSAQALVLIMVIPLALWFIRKDFHYTRIEYSKIKQMVHFGYPFVFTGIAYWLFGSMDRWMLASITSVEEVGIYSVAFRFASAVLFVSAAFGQAWSPVAIKISADHPENYQAIYGQVLLLLLFTMLAVGGGIALFSGEVISLLMPAEYQESALPLAILCFGIILQSTQQVIAVGISIENKTYLFARLAWLAALVNFVANWVLIPRFGAVGAAWGTLTSYFVLTGSYFYYTQRIHPIVVQSFRLSALLSLGALVALVSVIMISPQLDWHVVAGKMLLAAFCLIIGWYLLPLHSIRKVRS
jgi:O-antigen/teichoic acid export membrane protein